MGPHFHVICCCCCCNKGVIGADLSSLVNENKPLTSRMAIICGTSSCHMAVSIENICHCFVFAFSLCHALSFFWGLSTKTDHAVHYEDMMRFLLSLPGSIPGLGIICELSLLLVLVLAPRGFSPGTPVFPSPQKPTFPNYLIWRVSPVSSLC